MSQLSKSILKTLAFFDVQDLPLTLMEIRSYLGVKASLPEIRNKLASELAHSVETDGVFYYLSGRGELVSQRLQRYRTSLVRFRKAKKILRLMRFLPYVRGVAISGSLAILNSREDSDIDLFIIAATGRIWLARLFVTVYLQLRGQRRHGRYTENRFCLNHYIERDVVISRDKNIYTAILYSNFLPVFGLRHFAGFFRANSWIGEYVKAPVPEKSNVFFGYEAPATQKAIESVLELSLLAQTLNFFARLYQRGRIREQDYVYISDQELSFHPESKGQQILARFTARRAKFEQGLKEL